MEETQYRQQTQERYRSVSAAIQEVVHRQPTTRNVTLLAVSKTHPSAAVQAVYDVGHKDFGENYVDEILDKAPQLPQDIRWHMIGHLQTNKCKHLAGVPNLYMVQSVDSERLAAKLDSACAKVDRELNVLVQINTSGEASKYGVEPSEAVSLSRFVIEKCPRLRFKGLMTIGRYDASPKPECFQVLIDCRAQVSAALGLSPEDLELSMGMSADYEQAIAMGSSMIRVGTAIFGERTYPVNL
eukprot:GILK01009693.1.p1 GENE.GILK01009693.1~~GILK01009693.1.p1  ORF type:complete len:250 (-),score=38.85 GILK01009693.1:299-1021(-)